MIHTDYIEKHYRGIFYNMNHYFLKTLTFCSITTIALVSSQQQYPLVQLPPSQFTPQEHGFACIPSQENDQYSIVLPGEVSIDCHKTSRTKFVVTAFINGKKHPIHIPYPKGPNTKLQRLYRDLPETAGPCTLKIGSAVFTASERYLFAICVFHLAENTDNPNKSRTCSLVVHYPPNQKPWTAYYNGSSILHMFDHGNPIHNQLEAQGVYNHHIATELTKMRHALRMAVIQDNNQAQQ